MENTVKLNTKLRNELEAKEQEHKELQLKLEEETKTKKNLEKQNAQLKKDLQAKKESLVRVASTKTVVPSGDCRDWMKQAGITDLENAYILIKRESNCRVNATNRSSGAYGIPQALPGTKMATVGADWRTNPVTQLKWMQKYVFSRYGTWANAVSHSSNYGWY